VSIQRARQTREHLSRVSIEHLAVKAKTLRQGDDVCLSDERTAKLTTVLRFQVACSVYEFAFEPDLPVQSFSVPTSILSYGRQPRRSQRNVNQGSESNADIPDTDSELAFPQRMRDN